MANWINQESQTEQSEMKTSSWLIIDGLWGEKIKQLKKEESLTGIAESSVST